VFDDGSGPALFAGGRFTQAGTTAAVGIAKWNGSSWSSAGDVGGPNPYVHALAVFDDGTGQALYAGGDFILAGGVVANRIARRTGTTWFALGGGQPYRPLGQKWLVTAGRRAERLRVLPGGFQ
jgi:hypothetical protein